MKNRALEIVSDTFNTSKPTVSLKRKKYRAVKIVAATFTKDLTKTPFLGPDNQNNNHCTSYFQLNALSGIPTSPQKTA